VAIADKLFDENPPSGNDRQEYQAIRDGIRAGKESPTRIRRLVKTAPKEILELVVDDNSLVARINKYYNGLHDTESLSHFDLADLFIHLYSDELRYNNETRSWYRWRGNVWVQGSHKSNHVPVSFAGKMMTAVYEYGALIPDEKHRAKYMTTAFRMKTASSLEAIARMAEANITAESGTKKKSKGFFDIEKSREYKDYITVGNGMVNLATGELLPYNRDWCFTKMTPVEYHPGVKSEKFEEFIRQIFLDRTELINYVQAALGYSLTGRSGIQALFFCVGVGSNGKGTLFEILRNLYGDYYNKTDTTAFILDLKKSSNAANPFVAELMDTRIAVGDEYPSGTQMDNALVKNVTGSTALRGRMLNENPISFNPTHSMWFLSNYLPEMKQQDDGIWRRFKIIPFDYKIEKNTEKEMTDFVASFDDELPGILNWIVEGSIKMIATGKLPYCAIVEQLNDEFRLESDRLAEFLKVCCDVDRENTKDYWVSKKLAYRVWDLWKNEVGEAMRMTAKSFSREITSNRSTMGFKYGKRNDDYFLGFRIKPEYLKNIYDMEVDKLNGFGRKDLDGEEQVGFKPSNIIQMPARNLPIQLDDVADDTF
jgi:putative DNA primase/helicase